MLGQVFGADGDSSAQTRVVVLARKWNLLQLFSEAAQARHKDIFEGGFIDTNTLDRELLPSHFSLNRRLCLIRFVHKEVETVAESLHVNNFLLGTRNPRK